MGLRRHCNKQPAVSLLSASSYSCRWHDPCRMCLAHIPQAPLPALSAAPVYNAGWVSGTVKLPAQCAPPKGLDPMTAFECDTCLKSTDPKGCLDCSKVLFKDSCGFLRQSYWVRKRPSFIKWTRQETCLACICHTKDATARNRWAHQGWDQRRCCGVACNRTGGSKWDCAWMLPWSLVSCPVS
jgi:hypothetical protein